MIVARSVLRTALSKDDKRKRIYYNEGENRARECIENGRGHLIPPDGMDKYRYAMVADVVPDDPDKADVRAAVSSALDAGTVPHLGAEILKGLRATTDAARKALPVFRGVLGYFPDAILAVAAVSKAGNDQHNPGEPLHWARGKSTEQMDTALRHMMDHALGNPRDTDGTYHMAKAAWRCLAELQLAIEREEGFTRGA